MLCQQIDPEEKIYIVTYTVTWYTSLNQLKKTTCFGTLFQGIFGKSKLSLATYKDPKCNNFQQFVSWSQNREIGKWTYSWQQHNKMGMANHQSRNSMEIWIYFYISVCFIWILVFFSSRMLKQLARLTWRLDQTRGGKLSAKLMYRLLWLLTGRYHLLSSFIEHICLWTFTCISVCI